MSGIEKTNVMRLLDQAGIAYEAREYEVDEKDLSGSHAADVMGEDHDLVFKTLVLKGERTGHLVCCIPVDEELDLKNGGQRPPDAPEGCWGHGTPGRLIGDRGSEEVRAFLLYKWGPLI